MTTSTPTSAPRPVWATDTPLTPTTPSPSVAGPQKTIKIAGGYNGYFGAMPLADVSYTPIVVVGVFARCELVSKQLWVAIHIEYANVNTKEIKWMTFKDFAEADYAGKPWMKMNEEFCMDGKLDEGKIVSAWEERDEGFRRERARLHEVEEEVKKSCGNEFDAPDRGRAASSKDI